MQSRLVMLFCVADKLWKVKPWEF